MALKKLNSVIDEVHAHTRTDADVLDLDYVKAYLRVEHTQDDGLITNFIKTARSAIEAYTARALMPQAWEFTINAGFAVARSDVSYLSQSKSRGDHGIELPRSPFINLIGEPKLETPYGTKTLTDFRVDTSGRTTKIHFGSSAQSLMDGTGKITIQFQAGYTEEDLPESLRQALLMLVAQLYEKRSAVNDNPGLIGEFDRNVMMLLRPYQVKRLS